MRGGGNSDHGAAAAAAAVVLVTDAELDGGVGCFGARWSPW